VADRVAILLAGRLLAVHAVRGSADGKRFRLCIRGDQERVRLCLTRVPGVAAVALEGQARTSPATYLVDADHAAVAESVAGAVINAGFGLVSLQPLAIDLEALFLRLTGDPPDAAR
jgi:hypothetical protein